MLKSILFSLMSNIKSLIRKAFYRSGLVRLVVGAGSVLVGKSTPVGISHLTSYSEKDSIGPLQRDEAGWRKFES